MTDLYDRPYQTDYRNSVWNCGILPVYRQQLYSVYGEYKNTAREFFATVNLTHNREWYNRIYEQRIENGQVQRVSLPLSNHGSGYTVKSTLSKGFYDLGLKTSFLALLNISKAEQISGGQRLPINIVSAPRTQSDLDSQPAIGRPVTKPISGTEEVK